MSEMTLIAVYGTLRRGWGNHRLIAHTERVATGRMPNTVMRASGIPFVDDDTSRPDGVVVEVYAVDATTLAAVDSLEGYNPDRPDDSFGYMRVVRPVHTDDGTVIVAHTYLHAGYNGTPIIESGDYADHRTPPPDLQLTGAPMTPDRALQIATAAHDGQTDKAGAPYIGHIRRVLGHLPADATDDNRVVAALHDVVEDTSWTLDDLIADGLTAVQAAAVDAMTHRPNEPRDDYYQRVKADPVALVVKQADLADNSDATRLGRLDEPTRERLTRKYDAARVALGLTDG